MSNLPIQVAERLAYLNARIADKKAQRRPAAAPEASKNRRWSPEERELALKLKRDGWPCSQIGKKLGRTKNAVISQLYNLNSEARRLKRSAAPA